MPTLEGIDRSLFNNLLNGLAYCRMIYEGGEPVDFVYLEVNDAFVSQTGLADVVGKRASEAVPGLRELDGDLIRIYGRVAKSGKPERFEYFVLALQTWFQLSVYSPEQDHFVAIFDSISERKIAEAKIRRLTNLHAALSQCNQAIVRSASEEELFPQICRAAVEFGGMKTAWIGMLDSTTLMVRPVDSFGDDSGYLNGIEISIDAASPFGGGPTGIALREDRPYWCQDFRNDPLTDPWRERASQAGFGASAALPLHRNGVVAGAFILYSSEARAFDEEARDLLAEMAADISFALDNFARESERRQAQMALREKQRLLSEAQTIAHLGSWRSDLSGYIEWDECLYGLYGISAGNFTPTPEAFLNLIHADDRPAMLSWFDASIKGEKPGELIFRIILPNGSVRYICDCCELQYDEENRPSHLVGTSQDITERMRTETALIAAEEKFRGLVEQSIAGIYIIQDGKFVYVNPRCAEIFGLRSVDELIGTDPMLWVAAEDRGKIAEDFRQLLDGKARSILHDFDTQHTSGVRTRVGANLTHATHEGRPAIIGLLQDISQKQRADEQIQKHLMQLKTAVMSTVGVAMTISGMRDPYTAGHERRVADIAVALGAELGADTNLLEGLRIAGSLHDIGKVTIPSEILSKPGKLSTIEFRLVQGHSMASYDVLKAVNWSWPVAEIVLQHHERMDGSGYPHGLKGEAILFEARIIAVADVVEAMSSHRPYRASLGIDRALEEIERGRGTLYDPAVADACLKIFRQNGLAVPA